MNTIATLFSGYDMLLIFLVVLVIFGPKKLPDLAKGMGQAIREFHKAKDEIERELSKPAAELTVQPAPDKQEHNPAASVAATEPVSPAANPTAPRV